MMKSILKYFLTPAGIYQKLDYVKEIGVDVIWIQPFYKSPMLDNGYDVADYKSVGPLFGTIEDFKKLLKGVHDRGMKLIMDFVPNHSSDQCEWFKLSLKGIEPYKDFYVYRDAKKLNDTHSTYPNNWRSIFGGPAWTWREERKQYSFNQFSSKQPDLNYYSPHLRREMTNVLRYWMDMGVDGFRIDATKHLVEADHFRDEPVLPGVQTVNDYYTLNHTYTVNQPGSYELVKSWSALLKEYSQKDGQTRLVAVEDYNKPETLMRYFGDETHPGAHIPFNFLPLLFFSFKSNSTVIEKVIRAWTDVFPEGYYNWVLENHDNPRMSTKFNPESVDMLNAFILLLPGVATIYYGSELGLEDIKTRPDQRRDPQNAGGRTGPTVTRDASRGPMLWDDTTNAGFTTAKKPWLPVNPNYYRKNVKNQKENPISHLNVFKRLTKLRKTPVIQHGDFHTFMHGDWVYIFTRSLETETVAVLMNLGSETEEVCAKNSASTLPDTMFVYTSSIQSGIQEGSKVSTRNVDGTGCPRLRPFSTLVLNTSQGTAATYSIFAMFLTLFTRYIW
ncbi:unnamed protein product [Bemisia tabaci]|uniref:alpha-glucosidase n=1 Tax=Bemisia tabaci TaxID=7038 RepID=A0A9P0F811_BEMTA|nr:unnamed protein product [Bemisia tabaci]